MQRLSCRFPEKFKGQLSKGEGDVVTDNIEPGYNRRRIVQKGVAGIIKGIGVDGEVA